MTSSAGGGDDGDKPDKHPKNPPPKENGSPEEDSGLPQQPPRDQSVHLEGEDLVDLTGQLSDMLEAHCQHELNTHWHVLALDLLLEMSDIHIHANSEGGDDQQDILDRLEQCLKDMFRFERGGIFLVNDNNGNFELNNCWPLEQREQLKKDVKQLTSTGEFGFAVNRDYPDFVQHPKVDPNTILHVMATHTGTRGMLIATLKNREAFDMLQRKMLSVVLNNGTYALENLSLNRLIRRQRDDLEAVADRRTRELEHLSHHDLLTGLSNRSSFIQSIDNTIQMHRDRGIAVVYIDLSGFNRVNNTYGYQFGDHVLSTLAQRFQDRFIGPEIDSVQAQLLEAPVLARLGADEFGILLPGDEWSDNRRLRLAVDGILEDIAQPFETSGETAVISGSVGVGQYPIDGNDGRVLVSCAELAMMEARNASANGYALFVECGEDAKKRTSLLYENALYQALENDELVLHFQPKVDLYTEEVVGAEALIRWMHPERGLIMPSEFIPVAESSGLIERIGEWCLIETCKKLSEWHGQQGVDKLKISVNLSPLQLSQGDLVQRILNALHTYRVHASSLELELTETAVARDMHKVSRVLERLQEVGLTVAVDDFGTGYSSLILLKRLRADVLKIDRSFVRDLTTDPGDSAIVNALINMCHILSLHVIAEGVETREQLRFLQDMGCHEVQGYYVSRPLPENDFLNFVATWDGFH